MISAYLNKYFTEKRLFIIIGCLIIALRGIHFFSTLHDPYANLRVGDELEYHKWALKIAHGQLLREKSFFTSPLYAYFLGLLYSLGVTSIILLRSVNLILGVSSVFLIYKTAKTLFPPPLSLVSLAVSGFCLTPIFFETFPEKTPLVLFMTALTVYLVVVSTERNSLLLWSFAGISAGVSTLGHALSIIFIPAVCIHVACHYWKKWVVASKVMVLFGAGFFCAVLPATLHNYIADKDFVLICYNGGQNFFAGNNAQNADGTYFSPPFAIANLTSEESDYAKEAQRLTGRTMKPSEISKFWYQKAWADIKANPQLALHRYLRKLQWTFSDVDLNDTRIFEFYRERLPALRSPFWGFGLVSFLGLAGLLLSVKDARFVFFNAMIVFYGLLLSGFFVFSRYRLPLLVPLSILSSLTVMTGYEMFQGKRKVGYAVSMGSLLLIGLFVWAAPAPKSGHDDLFLDYYNAGMVLSEEDGNDRTLIELYKALAANPNHSYADRAAGQLVNMHLQRNEDGQAETLLRKYMKMYPDSLFLWDASCVTASKKTLSKGKKATDLKTSLEICSRALRLKPDSFQSLMNIAALYILSGDLGQAEKTYQTAATYFNDNPHLWVRMSKFHYEYTGDINKAVVEAENAVKLDAQNAQMQAWLTYLKTVNGQKKKPAPT